MKGKIYKFINNFNQSRPWFNDFKEIKSWCFSSTLIFILIKNSWYRKVWVWGSRDYRMKKIWHGKKVLLNYTHSHVYIDQPLIFYVN